MKDHDAPTRLTGLGIVLAGAMTLVAGCGTNAADAVASKIPAVSPTAAATASAEITKPPFSQPPLAAPTHVSWAIDQTDEPDRHLFELYYDGSAMAFRVVDASDRQLVVLPIAGSGIFGPETCMATAKEGNSNATWVSVDEPTYQEMIGRGSSYRVEVETVGQGTITLPLVDTGCRRG